MSISLIDQVLQPLYGKPCWNAKHGFASFLTFEFGQPHLEIREPIKDLKTKLSSVKRSLSKRNVFVHGEWHLWIYACNWKVLIDDAPIAYSSSSAERTQRAADELNGQALRKVVIDVHSAKTTFCFDFGGRLETTPYDKISEQWLLYEPSGNVFVLRADLTYAHLPADQPDDARSWHRL